MVDDDTDMHVEPEEEFGDVVAAQTKMKKLREELKMAQQKRDEYLDGWQRCKADSINARKDALQDAQRAGQREKDSFVADILPVLDSFDNAGATDAFMNMSEEWQEGIRRIQGQLLGILEKHGVERFGKTGELFDPRRYEAVQETDAAPGDAQAVTAVLRHGYRSGERIIRPAQVIIKK